MQPLLLLSWWQIKNSLRSSLRHPRVWIPLLLLAFIVSAQIGSVLFSHPQSPLPPEAGDALARNMGAISAAVFLTLALLGAAFLDRGLAGGALSFSPSDVACLFPAPFSRRLLLLFKLPAATLPQLLAVAFLAGTFGLFVWTPLQVRGSLHGGGVSALLAALLCAAGYINMGMILEVILSARRAPWARTGSLLVLGLALLGGITFLWRHGMGGLSVLSHSPALIVLFAPCRLAADIVAALLAGHPPALRLWAGLLAWYGLSLALLLSRRENYYEAAATGAERTARARQALRSGDWMATGKQPAQAARHAIRVPPFGQGAGALFWAHMAAAAKRSGTNMLAPLAGGIAVTLLLLFALPRGGGGLPDHSFGGLPILEVLLGVITIYYVLYAVVLTGIPFYRRSLAREPLIRPLPLPTASVIAADVGARSALASLFFWGEGLTLLAARLPETGTLCLCLLLCLPVGVVCLNLLAYRIALAYPNADDKAHALIATFVQFLLLGPLVAVLLPFWAVPAFLHAPASGSALGLLLGCSLGAVLLFRETRRANLTYEPVEEQPPMTMRQWRQAFGKSMSSPPFKRAAKPIVALLVIALLVVVIARRVSTSLHKPPPPPRTVAARVGDITVKVSETGTVEPVDKVDVKSKVAGRLLSIPIQEGQRVAQGQLIATVDRSLIDPQIARARAQLAQAQARYQQTQAQYSLQVQQSRLAVAQAQAGLNTAQAGLGTAQTHLAAVAAGARPQELGQQQQAVERARIALADAERTRKRRAGLLEKGFVSQADFDAAQTAADTAASSLAAARQQLALVQAGPRSQDIADARAQIVTARTQVQSAQVQVAAARANAAQNDVRRSDIAQAGAAVGQTRNDLAQLEVQLADTRILAPASGIVLKKYKQPNEIVQSATTGFSDAQSIVATLGSRLLVRVGINEVDIPRVRLGAPVVVRVDALPNVSWAGHVTEIAPASSNAFSDAAGGGAGGGGQSAIARFSVKVGLDGGDARLRPGMTAAVDIISRRRGRVILAPLEAVPGTGATATVSVLTGVKTQEKRALTLGLRDDADVEVLHGLRAGDRIVVPPINGKGRRKIDISGGP